MAFLHRISPLNIFNFTHRSVFLSIRISAEPRSWNLTGALRKIQLLIWWTAKKIPLAPTPCRKSECERWKNGMSFIFAKQDNRIFAFCCQIMRVAKPLLPASVLSPRPFFRSQTFRGLSCDPETAPRPSGVTATVLTAPVWPEKVAKVPCRSVLVPYKRPSRR